MALVQPSGHRIADAALHAPPPRRHAIDLLRGLAIAGMVTFHTAWDLAYWGWIDTSPARSPLWMAFGHAVAATFLFISGFCLVLARRGGTRRALRRITLLAATAAAITATTYWLFPDEYIYFGILHCIALANLIGLAFLPTPAWLILLAAGLAAITPTFAASYRFGSAVWWFVGLSRTIPPTLDYRPLLPWLAFVLVGMAAAKADLPVPAIQLKSRWRQALAWTGRHSLTIYAVHQPILFGLFFLIAMWHPRVAAQEQAAYRDQCVAQCVAAGAGRAGCSAACGCMLAQRVERKGSTMMSQFPTDSELQMDAQACLRADPLSR